MFMLFLVAVQMLMHKLAVKMHMLMDKICSQKKIKIAQHFFRNSIHLNAVIFTHDYGPFADLLYDLQVVRGSDYGLARTFEFL
jgi:hypothetical protein